MEWRMSMTNSFGNTNVMSNKTVVVGGGGGVSVDIGYDGSMGIGYDGTSNNGEQNSGTSAVSMDGLLSNWIFVGGISGAVFLISVAVGLLLAKHKIKKGFDVYED